jgi:hypothetical protein
MTAKPSEASLYATARPIRTSGRNNCRFAYCFSSIIVRRRDVGPQRNASAEARAISEVKDDHAEVLDAAGRSQQACIDALEADILREADHSLPRVSRRRHR